MALDTLFAFADKGLEAAVRMARKADAPKPPKTGTKAADTDMPNG